ncbi:MAG TPA: MTH938/NDUFAF3 family protein [Acidobacteriota bacterium]|nr:MTH938/NDUFAF3 family protein [Acidobacteriota bacterium]
MRIEHFRFGSVEIDGIVYEHDVVIDHGEISKRKKKASKKYRDQYGHTPLSNAERIPWNCRRLIIGTGAYGSLPVMEEVQHEAELRNIKLVLLPTPEAIQLLNEDAPKTNAILHVTC